MKLRRIISFLLLTTILLGIISGCSSKKTADNLYITKGEFFSYFVYENSMSSKEISSEEIEQSSDGSAAAKIIAEWGYLPEKLALGGINKTVTREIVVLVCANATFDLKEGNVKDIKDADLLSNPQVIANAYASGFFELENGYFDGAQKMTLSDCEEILNKSRDYTANFHYDSASEECEYAEDVAVDEGENYNTGDIVIDFLNDESLNNEQNIIGTSTSYNPNDFSNSVTLLSTESNDRSYNNNIISNMSYSKRSPSVVTLENSSNNYEIKNLDYNRGYSLNRFNNVKGFTARINKSRFENELKSPAIGSTVVLNRYEAVTAAFSGSVGNTIIGILKSCQEERGYYNCVFDYPDFEQAAVKIKKIKNNVSGIETGSFEKVTDSYMGWKLDFNISGNSLSVKASKDFTNNETGRKQDWQNAKQTVKATASFSLSDFNIDTNNIAAFATKRGQGYLKITCDTSFDFSLSSSLRYTPDDNRNGKFPSNWNNSRWTDSDSKGAKEIKIARFTPTNGVVGADIYIYLRISVDGKISFSTSIDDGGVQISTNNGNLSCNKLGTKKTEASANVNLNSRLGVDASLKIFGFINVIEYDVGANLNLTALVDLYYEEKLSKSDVFADEEGLNEYESRDSKFNYCIGISLKLSVSGELKDSAVKLILDALSNGTLLNFDKEIWTGSIHFEDGSFVDKCTRGEAKKEAEEKASKNDEIELSTYKVVMDNLTCKSIDLTALPKETEKFYGLISNSVTVKSLDENIARVNFDKARRTIIIEAYGEGSTEIIVYARKGVSWTKKPVEQKISVTVNSIYDSVSTVS